MGKRKKTFTSLRVGNTKIVRSEHARIASFDSSMRVRGSSIGESTGGVAGGEECGVYLDMLRSGDMKTMGVGAERAVAVTANELERLNKGGKGISKASTVRMINLVDAVLDCLSCVDSSIIIISLLTSLQNCSQMGRVMYKYLFSTDCIAISIKKLRRHKNSVRVVAETFRLLVLLCLQEKKSVLVLRLEGAMHIITETFSLPSLNNDPAVISNSASLLALLLKKTNNKLRLLQNYPHSVKSLVTVAKSLIPGPEAEPEVEPEVESRDSPRESPGAREGFGGTNPGITGVERMAVVAAVLPVFERLASLGDGAHSLAEAGCIGWCMSILNINRSIHMPGGGGGSGVKVLISLLKIIKLLLQQHPHIACPGFNQAGGFEVVWNAVCASGSSGDTPETIPETEDLGNSGISDPAAPTADRAISSVVLRLASSVLGYVQRYVLYQAPARHETNGTGSKFYDFKSLASPITLKQTPPAVKEGYPQFSTFDAKSDLNAFCPELWDKSIPEDKLHTWLKASQSMLCLPPVNSKGKTIPRSGEPPGVRATPDMAASQHRLPLEPLQNNPTGDAQYLRDMFIAFRRHTANVSSSPSPTLAFDSNLETPAHAPDVPPTALSGRMATAHDIPMLAFGSRFESGNLRRAIRIGPTEYNLILSPDSNTNGFTQWFYFQVYGMRSGLTYTLNIINNEKSSSAFNDGMRPVLFSYIENKRSGEGWVRTRAVTVSYFNNAYRRPNNGTRVSYDASHPNVGSSDSDDGGEDGGAGDEKDGKPNSGKCKKDGACYYTLSMALQFQHSGDVVRVAYSYPFTYTYLRRCTMMIMADIARRRFIRRQALCTTRAGNVAELLTITDFASPGVGERKIVFLSSRVHPGESNASWVMKGILQFLTSDEKEAKFLRKRVVFKIVPMLNPDGVIEGNYRCNLSGVDLNRNWEKPCDTKHPVISATKKLITALASQRPVLLYCDFHGHSTMKNFCLYGFWCVGVPIILKTKK
ncbi:hypothetical protein AAMO2058_001701100 [Amorphochlora amoebiformis]